jgi:hypothetical protein
MKSQFPATSQLKEPQNQRCHASLLCARGFFGPRTYCFLVFFLGTVPSPLVLISVRASLALKGY